MKCLISVIASASAAIQESCRSITGLLRYACNDEAACNDSKMKACLIAVMACSMLLPSTSWAIIPEIVYDPAVAADIVETFAYFEQEIQSLMAQLDVLNDQSNILNTAIEKLPSGSYNWSNTSKLIQELDNILSQSNALSYTAENVDQQFKNLFPGYISVNNYNEEYQHITESALDTLQNVLHDFNASANDFANETTLLKDLQNYSAAAAGQTQAIQVANQIASEQVSQLQLLRQALMTQANAQAVYYAQQIQNKASALAEFSELIDSGDTNTTGELDQHPLEQPNYEES